MWQRIQDFLSGSRFRTAAMSMILLVGAVSCAVREPGDVEGTWVITEAVIPDNNELSVDDTEMWLGQSFHYGSENITLGRTYCKSAQYAETKTTASEFKRDYNTDLQTLDIHDDTIRTVSVSCDEPSQLPGQTVLLAASGKAYTVWDGIFFKMEKTAPQTQADGL